MFMLNCCDYKLNKNISLTSIAVSFLVFKTLLFKSDEVVIVAGRRHVFLILILPDFSILLKTGWKQVFSVCVASTLSACFL